MGKMLAISDILHQEPFQDKQQAFMSVESLTEKRTFGSFGNYSKIVLLKYFLSLRIRTTSLLVFFIKFYRIPHGTKQENKSPTRYSHPKMAFQNLPPGVIWAHDEKKCIDGLLALMD